MSSNFVSESLYDWKLKSKFIIKHVWLKNYLKDRYKKSKLLSNKSLIKSFTNYEWEIMIEPQCGKKLDDKVNSSSFSI